MSTKIRVSKAELLVKLKENREIHIAEFEELKTDYLTGLEDRLKKILKSVKSGNFETNIRIDLVKPKSFEDEYNEVIGMLEMSIDDTYEIDQDEYRQYVLNKWHWTSSFAATKASYGKF